ncbi:MAG: serine/threonine-protein kinase [Gemmataceae bacterium]
MLCPDPDLLQLWRSGLLPASAAKEIAEHARDCPVCGKGGLPVEPPPESQHDQLNTPVADGAEADGPQQYLQGPVAHYNIVRLLGEGGMGQVYHAQDTRLGRDVALKVMKPELARNARARERFMREARAMATVRCDHIVTIHDVGEHNGLPYLAMEFLQGVSLRDWLLQVKKPTLRDILRLGRELAHGLAAAHKHGLVHRDIKPSNLWIEDHKNRLKILDFGLAWSWLDTGGNERLTHSDRFVGTPHYMSPEQARSDPVDHRSDLFSLGCVLYEMVAGSPPFDRPNPMAVLTALATEQPTPLQEVVPDLPGELAALIEELIAKDPEDRPFSAQEVADRLEQIEATLPAALATWTGQSSVEARARRTPPDRSADQVSATRARPLKKKRRRPGTHHHDAAAETMVIPPARGRGFWIGLAALGILVVAVPASLLLFLPHEARPAIISVHSPRSDLAVNLRKIDPVEYGWSARLVAGEVVRAPAGDYEIFLDADVEGFQIVFPRSPAYFPPGDHLVIHVHPRHDE